jgi:hypothetical protein
MDAASRPARRDHRPGNRCGRRARQPAVPQPARHAPADRGDPPPGRRARNRALQTRRARTTADRQAQQAQELDRAAGQARETATAGGQRAGETQQDATAREGTNRQAQQQQGEAQTNVGSYPERAAGLATLITPLHAFRGFLHYAEMLPGDVGGKFHQMDGRPQASNGPSAKWASRWHRPPPRAPAALAGWQQEQQQIVAARGEALGAQQTFEQQTQNAERISATASAAGTQRRAASARAAQHEGQVSTQIAQRNARATSLAGELAAWATEHRAARMRAIEATRARYIARGYRVTVRGE